jgi:hypothetical protein
MYRSWDSSVNIGKGHRLDGLTKIKGKGIKGFAASNA